MLAIITSRLVPHTYAWISCAAAA